METAVNNHLAGIKFGDIQCYKQVSVIPLLGSNGAGSEYLTMKEAMEQSLISIMEVTEGGHVPELKVKN
ncbi:MAG: DUF6569 family protein, partial [Syntrophales bacterium]